MIIKNLKNLKDLTDSQKEIINVLKVLSENDCDLDTIAIFLNPDYERCDPLTEVTTFQKEIEQNLRRLKKLGVIKKNNKKLSTFFEDGSEEEIDYVLWKII